MQPPASAEIAETSEAALPVAAEEAGQQGPGHVHPCFVIMHSVAKKHNVGTISRCCTAFGVKEICLAGSRHFNSFGSMGSDAHCQLRHFPRLEACVAHLKEQEGCEVVGIEITDDALPIQDHPFSGPTAFMLGNEGQGLSEKQMALCDKFVYIPQIGSGTASLNVAVATSIVLHHFATWAGYAEQERAGHKFVVADRPQRVHGRGTAGTPEQVRAEREAAAVDQSLTEEQQVKLGAALAGLFD